jgi:hypothetical protein
VFDRAFEARMLANEILGVNECDRILMGEQHSSHWESRGSCATRPVAAVDPGILPGAKPSPWDSPMPTSNRSVSRP